MGDGVCDVISIWLFFRGHHSLVIKSLAFRVRDNPWLKNQGNWYHALIPINLAKC